MITRDLYWFIAFIGPMDVLYCYFATNLRVIEREEIQFWVGGIFFPILINASAYYFFFEMGYGIYGLPMGWCFGGGIVCLICIFFYYRYR